MKKQLLTKIYIFIPIVIGMLSIVTANAQIVYTDVNPDVVRSCSFTGGCGSDYSIDLNNDGINDFTLSPRADQFMCGCDLVAAFGERDSAVISSTSQSWIADQAGGYPLNTLIDSSLGWNNALHLLALNPMICVACTGRGGRPAGTDAQQLPATGPWNNVHGKYLALKIQSGTDFFYGWIKLGVSVANYSVSITIMEYAYNSIPNQPILAGQTNTTGIIQNSFASSINLFPNPANCHLTIALPNANEKVEVTIADITGKIIYSTTASETQKIEVNTKDFIEGVYVVQIQSADFTTTKRLVIEK